MDKPLLVDEMRKLAGEATPGPWAVDNDFIVTLDPVELDMERRAVADARYFHMPYADANATYIAAANPAQIIHFCDLIDSQAKEIADLKAGLKPFAEMCRVAEKRALLNFGVTVPDREIIIESSGEAGHAVVRMGDFRKARALLPLPSDSRRGEQ